MINILAPPLLPLTKRGKEEQRKTEGKNIVNQ